EAATCFAACGPTARRRRRPPGTAPKKHSCCSSMPGDDMISKLHAQGGDARQRRTLGPSSTCAARRTAMELLFELGARVNVHAPQDATTRRPHQRDLFAIETD